MLRNVAVFVEKKSWKIALTFNNHSDLVTHEQQKNFDDFSANETFLKYCLHRERQKLRRLRSS